MRLNQILTFVILSVSCLTVLISCSDDDDGTGPPTAGSIEIASTPAGALVFIDDVDQQKQTPCTLTNIQQGSYSVTLKKELHVDWDSTVQVIAGKTTTVEAILIEVEYTLTVNVDGHGSVTKTPDQPTYRFADTIELTAVPDSGYKFDSWSGDLQGDQNPDTIIMSADQEVTAAFVELILMQVTGTISRADGERLFNPYAFLDTSSTDTVVIFNSRGWPTDAETGEFRIWFEPEGLESLLAIVSAYDDINRNQAIDPNEPIGWWDLDSNGEAEAPNDFILLKPREPISGANVVLYPGPNAASVARKRPEGIILRLR